MFGSSFSPLTACIFCVVCFALLVFLSTLRIHQLNTSRCPHGSNSPLIPNGFFEFSNSSGPSHNSNLPGMSTFASPLDPCNLCVPSALSHIMCSNMLFKILAVKRLRIFECAH